ncbi:MAG: homoserine dehydrogenase [Thermoleophilia bacterium]
MDKVGIGLLGYGTVGSGVGKLLGRNAEDISLATGKAVYLRRVLEKDPGFSAPGLDPALLTTRFEDILEDPEIAVVVELIGGVGAALDFQRRALQAGKHVVTANKQLLAQHGAELFAAAEASGVHLRFEASAVGAVPVIKVLRESLVAAEVKTIFGIVNGTTNYMLSAMADTGADYGDVLKEAQRLGFAEADPSEDVGGKDAAAKMAILSSIGFHSRTRLDDVAYEGITNVTAVDIAHGKQLGLVAKLLGVAKLIDGAMNVRVYPAFIPMTHPLAGVTGAYNAVFLESDAFDRIMLFGPGAGSVPTASAVIGDIISVVNTVKGSFVQNCMCYKDLAFFPDAEMVSSFYLRLRVADQPGVLARIAALFGEQGVSIASMVQEGGGDAAEIVLVLHPVREAQFFTALGKIKALPDVLSEPAYIRVEGEA